MLFEKYDIIVVGAGHAGCEAAAAGARLGNKVLLVTMDLRLWGVLLKARLCVKLMPLEVVLALSLIRP